MFLDASAVVSMIALEPDASQLVGRLQSAPSRLASAIVVYEATLAVARLKNRSITSASAIVSGFMDAAKATVVPIDGPVASLALDAFERYRKGRHRAALNMGDCFSYACAKAHEVPLLFKGTDFALTDVAVA